MLKRSENPGAPGRDENHIRVTGVSRVRAAPGTGETPVTLLPSSSNSLLPWSLVLASLIAMTALYFTSEYSIVPPIAGVLLVVNRLTPWRMSRNRALSWSIRAAVYTAVIALMGLPTERSIGPWYLNPQYTNTLGGLLCAEIDIRAFELPPAPGGLILLLSTLIIGAAGDTWDRSSMPLLAPIYIILVILALRSLMPRPTQARSTWLSLQRLFAAALAMLIGMTTIRALVQIDPEIQRWAADLFRSAARGSEIGLNGSPSLGRVFNPEPSMQRVLLIDGPRQDRYLRVLAYDNLVGTVWRPALHNDSGRKFTPVSARELSASKSGAPLHIQIIGDTLDILPLPLNAAAVISEANIDRDQRGSLEFHEPVVESQFDAIISAAPDFQGPICIRLDAAMRQRYLELPDKIDSRIVELARRIVKDDDSPLARGTKIAQNLRSTHEYSLEFSPAGDPLADFILNNRAAHCEYFASALVVMCRAVGVPARFVTGYYAHEFEGDSRAVVRDRDAHAWAECWIDGTGWITLDATPTGGLPDARFGPPSRWRVAWEHIVDFPGAIRDWLGGLTREQVYLVVFICAGAVIVIQLIQSRRKRLRLTDRPYAQTDERLTEVARRFEKWLTRNGQPCATNRTWREHLDKARDSQAPLRFIEVYEEARFGKANGERFAQMEQLLRSLDE